MSHPAPKLLRPDNFTPATRTPWGGTRLLREYKRAHVSSALDPVVGESWEVSVEPDFPGRLDDGRLLTEYLAEDAVAILGEEARRPHGSTALLVKYIDTSAPLSVQIHPDDDYAGLGAGECGKPESWYVVECEPGAGLFLGFQRGTTEADVRAALANDGANNGANNGANDGAHSSSLEPLLRFVPVEPGDFFLIDAGTPHAIGAGLTLVEPQHVMPGRRGVTYRYWDWNRRYDAQGRPDAEGSPRALHVEHALAVTNWQRVQEDDFIASIRVRAGSARLDGAARWTPLAGDDALASRWLRVGRLDGTGTVTLPRIDRLQAITVMTGQVRLGELTIERGRSAVIPAWLAGTTVKLEGAHAMVTAIA